MSILTQEGTSFLSDNSRIRTLVHFIIKGLNAKSLNRNIEKAIVINVVCPFFSWPTHRMCHHTSRMCRDKRILITSHTISPITIFYKGWCSNHTIHKNDATRAYLCPRKKGPSLLHLLQIFPENAPSPSRRI